MDEIRVMVVDDSALSRRAVRRALEHEEGIEIAAGAWNGADALEKLPSTEVDVLVVDLQMPVMDGIEFLRELRDRSFELPVVVVSARTREGAPVTVNALLEGADGYVAKPTDEAGGFDEAVAQLRRELVPCLESVKPTAGDGTGAGGEREDHREPAGSDGTPVVGTDAAPSAEVVLQPEAPVGVVGIAVSTGGPAALVSALEPLPADFDVPVLVVQHMPAAFTPQLAERLDRELRIGVHEAESGVRIEGGDVWIAPGGRHLAVDREGETPRLRVFDAPKVNSCRPSADVLFESLAESFADRAIGFVMTGMGEDGLQGCLAIHRAGGSVLVQDQSSSVAWGMPRGPVEAGIVDGIVPLQRIGPALRRIVERSDASASD